uniref:Uncharacterized protein n=1 Tax=Arundo donax TaxID=35708 RepID=A0A0A9EHH0_ARUDO
MAFESSFEYGNLFKGCTWTHVAPTSSKSLRASYFKSEPIDTHTALRLP